MSAYETYKTFLAFKKHFTSEYDYIKYSGKVKASTDTFETRPDKFLFQKLSKHKNLDKFIISNFVDGNVQWVNDLLSDDAEDVYNNWVKRQQSLAYIFRQEIENLLPEFNNNFIVENGQHPPLLRMFLRKKVSIDTLIILNDLLGFFKHWNKSIEDNIIWPGVYKKCLKYKPFLYYDITKFRKILREHYTS